MKKVVSFAIVLVIIVSLLLIAGIWRLNQNFSPPYEGGEPSDSDTGGGGQEEAIESIVKESDQLPACQLATLPQQDLNINDQVLTVGVASSSAERAQGLSGCAAISTNSGLLFTFAEPKKTAFWMKDMLIPIDIIWISNGVVTGVNANVPPPADSSAPDSELAHYVSPTEVDHVLELAAGQAAHLKIDTGTEVQ